MPIIIEEKIRSSPSLHRKQYADRNRSVDIISNVSASTVELPHPRGVEYLRPSQLTVIHQDHLTPVTNTIRESEYVIQPIHGANGKRQHRSGYARRRRARSVGFEDYYSSCGDSEYSNSYSHHNRSRRRSHGEMGGGLVRGRRLSDADIDTHNRIIEITERHNEGQHNGRTTHAISDIGISAVGGRVLYDGMSNRSERRRAHRARRELQYESHTSRDEANDLNRKARRIAEAGLGIAAASAATGLYNRYKRHNRSRSRSWSSSSSEGGHTGRHVAAAALGATAAGLAAHKIQQHRRESASSRPDDEHHHHYNEHHHEGSRARAPLIAATAVGATAAGLAAKHMQDRNNRSPTSHGSQDRHPSHKLRDAALMLGAAGLAARQARSHSRARSRSRQRRHRSSSESSSDPPSHNLRNATLGLGTADLLARNHREHQRERERSNHRNDTHSPVRHRSRSRGATLAKVAAVTIASALADRQIRKHHERRARSADAAAARRGYRHRDREEPHRHHSRQEWRAGGSTNSYAEEESVTSREESVTSREESVTSSSSVDRNRSRSRRGSVSMGDRLMDVINDRTSPRHGSRNRSSLAQDLAYRVGEGLRKL